MDTLSQDVRYALRSLLKRPGFSLIAVATLALGIGINTGMFSVVRAVLLEGLPYADAERIVRVHGINAEGGVDRGVFSPLDFEDIAEAARTLARPTAFFHAPGLSNVALTGTGEAALLEAAYVSGDFFATLGVAPLQGRLPSWEELSAGTDRVAVLSHALWQSRFGGSSAVVGSTVTIQGEPYTVLGVMPPAFGYPSADVRVWLPLSLITDDLIPRSRGVRYLGVIGRLAPGADPAAATAEIGALYRRLAETYPETNRGWDAVRVSPLRDELIGTARRPLLVLSIAVGLVLLIACANLLNLLLARASSRRGEFALRAALGAGRGRLVRQLVTESTLLALVGGAAGILAALWLTSLMLNLGGASLPRVQEVRVDGVVVGFALLLSIVTGVVTGVLPAWRASAESAATLREGGRGGTEGRQRQRLRGTLVAAEMALAVTLVISAGLMLASLTHLLRVEPGFDAANVLAVSLTVPNSRAQSLEESIVYRNLLQERLSALPGVHSVAVARALPLERGGEPFPFTLPDQGDAVVRAGAGTLMVSPEYFETLGIPLLRGRLFDDRERRNAEGMNTGLHGSLIINDALARTLFADADPIGQRLQLNQDVYLVVGVVGDVRHLGLHEAPPTAIYIPIDLSPRLTLRFLLRTEMEPAALTAAVRSTIRELEPDQPIAEIVPLGETLRRAAARERFLTALLGGFAGLALVLAALGVYGVVAYGVTQRMHEMGIRIALGARPSAVARLVISQSAVWWGSGLLVGLALAAASTRVLESLVYGVSVRDAPTFAGVALLLGCAALLASAVPAVRASRADPTSAFR
jgi:predicted permease